MNILLVEDEIKLSEILCVLFKQNGYAVHAVFDGMSGEEHALTGIYDVIVLDIMLPKKSGFQVVQNLRNFGLSTPVLLLTAKSETEDKILGLDLGADDYLSKPFSSKELLARLRALTRRQNTFVGDLITLNNTSLNRNTHEIICKNDTVKLGMKEFQIMETLLQNKDKIISKELMIEKIWGYDYSAEYNTIEVYISFLRKKLNSINADIQIKTERGIGYFLDRTNSD